MNQVANEVIEKNMYQHDTMITISNVYLSNSECSAQKTVYQILKNLKLRIIFPAVYFVNKNLPEERVQVLLSENQLSELTEESPNIFKKSDIDRYMEGASATFCNGKYIIFNGFCHTEFLAYYTFENKSRPANIIQMNLMII